MKQNIFLIFLLAAYAQLNASPVLLVNEPSHLPAIENDGFIFSSSAKPVVIQNVSPPIPPKSDAEVRFGSRGPELDDPVQSSRAPVGLPPPTPEHGNRRAPATFPAAAERKAFVLKHHPPSVLPEEEVPVWRALPTIPSPRAPPPPPPLPTEPVVPVKEHIPEERPHLIARKPPHRRRHLGLLNRKHHLLPLPKRHRDTDISVIPHGKEHKSLFHRLHRRHHLLEPKEILKSAKRGHLLRKDEDKIEA